MAQTSKRWWWVLGAATAAALVGIVLVRAGKLPSPTDTVADKVAETKRGFPTKKPKQKNAYLETDIAGVRDDEMPPGNYRIVDIHEHAQNVEEAARMLKAMDAVGVQRTCLQASTIYTFTLDNKWGFEQWKENNDEILRIKAKWPDRFCAFITIDPLDPDHLAYVKDAVSRGADGVKLYIGHGAGTGKGPFHVMPIDDDRMEPFFAWTEQVQLPVLMHVNLIKFWDETVNVLERHPHLRLCIPHFGLHKNSEARRARFGWLLERYPFLYTDESYGHHDFHIEGFETLSKDRTKARTYLRRHARKILFASDIVLEKTKTDAMLLNTMRSYRQWNELEKFRLFLVPSAVMHGMGLDADSLRSMYEQAPKNFLLMDDKGMLPDRTKNPAVEVERPLVAALDRESIPDDPQYTPRTTGPVYGSAASLARKGVAPPPSTGGAGGEGVHHSDSDCEGEDEGVHANHAQDGEAP
jgi:predicted TIM-barrel fold metal-dependent hydrolase